jgi:L-threonate 2-dehydrogenase
MDNAIHSAAVIGLGIMGGAIARNLVAAGFEVAGFDIDPAALQRLGADGGRPAASVVDAARDAGLVLTSLPSEAALDATVAALLASPRPGLIVAELSTLPLAAKEGARDRLAGAGIAMLDCPLSGTGAQAETRDLAVYASGDEAAYARCRAVFAGFARASDHLGQFGNGTRMKLVANLLVAVHNVASAEAMVLGMKAGLDPALIARVIAGNSRIFELRSPLMVEGRYAPPTMKIGIWQKDMAIIAEFARALGVPTPTFDATTPVYDAALAAGRGGEDTAAVCAVLEERAGIVRSKSD